MNALTLGELETIAGALNALVGAQLQDVWIFETSLHTQLGLGFYHERAVRWLWFDLNTRLPQLIWLEALPTWAKKKSTKPLTLFIKANVEGQRLLEASVPEGQGKVLRLKFPRAEIEARLFVGGVNVIVSANDKTVSLEKIRELAVHDEPREPGRTWQELTEQWRAETAGQKSAGAKSSGDQLSPLAMAEKQWQRDLEKKQRALEKMRDDLQAKQNPIWRQAGDWLKGEGSLEFPHGVPPLFLEVIDTHRSLSENIELVFKKAKDSERKQEGSRERIILLESEIAILQDRGPHGGSARKQQRPTQSLLAKAEARGRQLHVADGLDAYIGKSAGDNLALLRKAQPFDYWLHLRDYPGTHAILRRARTRVVKDSEFSLVGSWVAQQSLGKTADELKGIKLDVLIVECRYVRPIKGDKLGRVHYTHDRVLTCRL